MLFDDTYKTIKQPAEGIFRDRGSKFYRFCISGDDSLTADRSVFRLNDEGKPSGTAGRPILNILLPAILPTSVWWLYVILGNAIGCFGIN